MYKQNTDWRVDKYATESTPSALLQMILPNSACFPGTTFRDGGVAPTAGDPVVYQQGDTPTIYNINLTSSGAAGASAVLTVTASQVNNQQQLLVFSSAEFTFDSSGNAIYPYQVVSSQALPSGIANINATLTWFISINGAAPFQFATSTQKIFVTVASPMGFAGGGNIPGAPTITAVRVSLTTTDLAGGVDSESAANLAQGSFQSLAIPFGPGNYSDFGLNAWAIWDNLTIAKNPKRGLDCFSQTSAVTYLLLMAGVNASLSFAYPTETTNQAGSQDQASIDPSSGNRLNAGTQSHLDFLDAGGLADAPQDFEAYFFLCSAGGNVSSAQTVAPRGFFQESQGVTEACSGQQPQLAFTIIATFLQGTQAQPSVPYAGRQWWVANTNRALVFGPVAFPPNTLGVK